jgi:hypothetical protein
VPQTVDAYLWACQTQTCATDFGFQSTHLPQYGIYLFGPIQATVTAAPESSTLLYLIVGIALGLSGVFVREFSRIRQYI